MESNPKISVIVPVYNVSDYIERCILSIMEQTYKNIECIVIDDCTPDDSMTKALNLIHSYKGEVTFVCKKHTQNRGLSAGRNTGVKYSTGDYLFFLDSDDEILPDAISILVDEVIRHPKIDVVLGQTISKPISPNYDFSHIGVVSYIEDNKWIRDHFFDFPKRLPVNAWNKLINKAFFIKNELWFKEGLIHEDELWSYHTYKRISNMAVVQKSTYIHYYTDNSIMSAITINKMAKHWSVILNCILESIDSPSKNRQIVCYTVKAVYFFGVDDAYNDILMKFKKMILKQHYYDIYIMLCILKLANPHSASLIKTLTYQLLKFRLKYTNIIIKEKDI